MQALLSASRVADMKTVLLIDDEEHEHMFVSYLLKDRYDGAVRVDHARSMDAARECLASRRVDVILLDDKLGDGTTSADSIPMLQRQAFNVPIIVLSKDTSGPHLRDRVLMGTNRVVDKFDFRDALAEGLLD
ncbi:MAG: response regulator [Litorimonas sp.]